MCRFPLVAVSRATLPRGTRASHLGSSSCGAQALGPCVSVVAACGIFLDQGLNACLWQWEADSLPLGHQGSPLHFCFNVCFSQKVSFMEAGIFVLVQFSRLVLSNSLLLHGLRHARLPCPSPTPRAYSNSCPSSRQ